MDTRQQYYHSNISVLSSYVAQSPTPQLFLRSGLPANIAYLNNFSMGEQFVNTEKKDFQSKTISILLPELTDYFSGEFVAGVESITNKLGYQVLISKTSKLSDQNDINIRRMINNKTAGVIVCLFDRSGNQSHQDTYLPVCFIEKVPVQTVCPTAFIDDEEAAYNLTKHLVEQGAKKIIHISPDPQSNVHKQRYLGYRKALKENGLKFKKSYLIKSDYSKLDETFDINLALELGADAIFAAEDRIAIHCMNELKKIGIRIPEDILLAGFNNEPITLGYSPSLTTIDYPAFQIGAFAGSRLLGLFTQTEETIPAKIIKLETRLIVRNSTQR